MKKSVSTQLLEYLQTNHGVHASGNLQRLEWRNRDGTLAVPRTVVRRLQELAADGKIHIQYTGNHAHYSTDAFVPPQHKPHTIYVEINGQLVNVKDL
jgi:hypothetical protein